MPTKKKSADRRSTFSVEKNGNSNNNQEEAASTQTQYQPTTSPTAAFSIPPTAMVAAFEYEEDEEDVSYEIALVSCIMSLAIGFGTGYLV